MDPRLQKVTLAQILSHTGGLPKDNEAFGDLIGQSIRQDGNLDEQRYWLVTQWSAQPLEAEPGTAFAYSNLGYVLAGAMLERIGRKSWEELITERVFVPLPRRLEPEDPGPHPAAAGEGLRHGAGDEHQRGAGGSGALRAGRGALPEARAPVGPGDACRGARPRARRTAAHPGDRRPVAAVSAARLRTTRRSSGQPRADARPSPLGARPRAAARHEGTRLPVA
jgi:hypothetical protein